MFLKHLATPIEPFRDPPGGRDPQFEEPWFRATKREVHCAPCDSMLPAYAFDADISNLRAAAEA